jgi:hypothetical protein
LKQSTVPVNVRDSRGRWQPVDTGLRSEAVRGGPGAGKPASAQPVAGHPGRRPGTGLGRGGRRAGVAGARGRRGQRRPGGGQPGRLRRCAAGHRPRLRDQRGHREGDLAVDPGRVRRRGAFAYAPTG